MKASKTSVTTRTSDEAIYLSEDRYESPKEVHKFIIELARRKGALQNGRRVLDAGCAAGEFISAMLRVCPHVMARGFDPVESLIAKACSRVSKARFDVGSILQPHCVPRCAFDTVFCLGVLGIFDDFRPPLKNLLAWTRDGGRCFVSWMFNDYPIDVWVRYRDARIHGLDHRESGWNIFSKKSVTDFLLEERRVERVRFHPFEISIDLDPKADDPARTWTFKDEHGRCLTTNGLLLLIPTEVMEIVLVRSR